MFVFTVGFPKARLDLRLSCGRFPWFLLQLAVRQRLCRKGIGLGSLDRIAL
jgi:hypothetical protein